jgi:dipeptidyl aminopeptidase/acylaminoacyl peptidase
MVPKKHWIILSVILLLFVVGCSATDEGQTAAPSFPALVSDTTSPLNSSATPQSFAETNTPPARETLPLPSITPSPTASATIALTPTPTVTDVVFEVGQELTIDYLRDLEIMGSEITFEQQLNDRSNYHQHLVSYISEGNKIYGLLTIPFVQPPEGGFKDIVFNHGYIPPSVYRTTERYTAYVDYLARSGFVVFKIDYRGHGQSQGEPTGSYFSPGYTIDAITALKSLQILDFVDPQGIGMWGHSMAGNLVLRAMLIEAEVKAGVIWAGAVYSYDDFGQYGIDDNTYRPPQPSDSQESTDPRRRSREIFDTYGRPDTQVDYWKAVSLTENLGYLTQPIQLHHAEDDSVVDIGYSYGLAAALQENGRSYEFYTYESGGHNLISPYFEQAMMRTVEFFRKYL